MNTYNVIHFIQIWLLPPGLILLLMLTGFITGMRWPRGGKLILIITFGFFWLISTPIVSQALYQPLENQYPDFHVKGKIPEHAAIVVLGAGVNSAATLLRTHYAAMLANMLHLPVITSGGNRGGGVSEAEMMRAELQAQYHVPVLAIEQQSRNTQEESRTLLPLLVQHHLTTIYLVTHAYHIPRSVYIFRQYLSGSGINVIPVPMGKVELLSNDTAANYLPQANALNASVTVLHEYIGLLWYRL